MDSIFQCNVVCPFLQCLADFRLSNGTVCNLGDASLLTYLYLFLWWELCLERAVSKAHRRDDEPSSYRVAPSNFSGLPTHQTVNIQKAGSPADLCGSSCSAKQHSSWIPVAAIMPLNQQGELYRTEELNNADFYVSPQVPRAIQLWDEYIYDASR